MNRFVLALFALSLLSVGALGGVVVAAFGTQAPALAQAAPVPAPEPSVKQTDAIIVWAFDIAASRGNNNPPLNFQEGRTTWHKDVNAKLAEGYKIVDVKVDDYQEIVLLVITMRR